MEAQRVIFDAEADVLYLWSRDPSTVESIVTEETGEEILVKKDAETGETVGVSILHVSTRPDAVEGIALPTASAL